MREDKNKDKRQGYRDSSSILFSAIAAALLILIAIPAALAIPDSLNVIGKLTGSAGDEIVGNYNFSFRIYDNYTAGTRLFQLNTNLTTDRNGIYDVILQNMNLNFSDQFYLGVAVFNDEEMLPRINLSSTPYAFRANVSEGLNPLNTYKVANLNVTGIASISVLNVSANISLENQVINRWGDVIGFLTGLYNRANWTSDYTNFGGFNLGNLTAWYSTNGYDYENFTANNVGAYKKENLTIDYPNLDTDSGDDLAVGANVNITLLNVSNNITLRNQVINYWGDIIGYINGLYNRENFTADLDSSGVRTSINNNVTSVLSSAYNDANTTSVRTSITNNITAFGASAYKKENLTIDYPNLDTNSGDDLAVGANVNITLLNVSNNITLRNQVINYWGDIIGYINGLYNRENFTADLDSSGVRASINNNVTSVLASAYNDGNTTSVRTSITNNITAFGASAYKKENLTIDYPNLDTNSGDDLAVGANVNITLLNVSNNITLRNQVINYWGDIIGYINGLYNRENFTSDLDSSGVRASINNNVTSVLASAYNDANTTSVRTSITNNITAFGASAFKRENLTTWYNTNGYDYENMTSDFDKHGGVNFSNGSWVQSVQEHYTNDSFDLSQISNTGQVNIGEYALTVGGGFGSGGLTIQDDGTIKTEGDIWFSGNITVLDVDNLRVNASHYPSIDNTYSLGNASLRWLNGNFSGVVNANKFYQNFLAVLDTSHMTSTLYNRANFSSDYTNFGGFNLGNLTAWYATNGYDRENFSADNAGAFNKENMTAHYPNLDTNSADDLSTGAKVNLTELNVSGQTLFTNGNVGIGTTSPTQKLEVVGNTIVNGLLNASNITSQTLYEVSTQNLVLAMNLNNESIYYKSARNLSMDSSPFSNHGQIIGPLPHSQNKGFNDGGTFNFSNNMYIKIPHNETLVLDGNFTISVWFYRTVAEQGDVIGKAAGTAASNSEYLFSPQDSVNVLYFRSAWNTPGGTTQSDLGVLNKWIMATITYDASAGTISWYIDGKLRAQTTNTNSYATTTTGNLYLGKQGDGTNNFFKGYIDDARIYKNRILTPTEVYNLYAQKAEIPMPMVSQKKIFTDVSGKVGIGTNNPVFNLQTDGTLNAGEGTFVHSTGDFKNTYWDTAGTGQIAPAVMFRKDSSATTLDSAPSGFVFYNKNGGDTTWVKLSLAINEDTSSSSNPVSIAGIGAQKWAGSGGNWASGDIILWTKAGSEAIEILRGTSTNFVLLAPESGRVGINTSSPKKALEVVGEFTLNATGSRQVYTNGTCVIIQGPTSQLAVC